MSVLRLFTAVSRSVPVRVQEEATRSFMLEQHGFLYDDTLLTLILGFEHCNEELHRVMADSITPHSKLHIPPQPAFCLTLAWHNAQS